jgi:hypothetical protein
LKARFAYNMVQMAKRVLLQWISYAPLNKLRHLTGYAGQQIRDNTPEIFNSLL